MRKCIWPLTQTIWPHLSMYKIHSIITCFSSEIQPEVLPTLESNFPLETVVHLKAIWVQFWLASYSSDHRELGQILCVASVAQWLVFTLSKRKVMGSNPPMVVHTPCRSPRLAPGYLANACSIYTYHLFSRHAIQSA